MTSENRRLINVYFYNPFLEKRAGRKREISHLLGVSENDVHDLQYDERETKDFIEGARVFGVDYYGKHIKARYCRNKREAEGVFLRAKYASETGIPMSEPLGVLENLALFSYIEGRSLSCDESELYLDQIASAQHSLSKNKFGAESNMFVEELLTKMISRCVSKLKEVCFGMESLEKIEKILEVKPDIIGSFDHQDYGLHNLILGEDKRIYVVDEEAFGLLPFGYGIVRPIFDRENYKVTSKKNLERYLSFFTIEQREYVTANLDYFRAIFILRNCLRRYISGNTEGAIKLISEVNELK